MAFSTGTAWGVFGVNRLFNARLHGRERMMPEETARGDNTKHAGRLMACMVRVGKESKGASSRETQQLDLLAGENSEKD